MTLLRLILILALLFTGCAPTAPQAAAVTRQTVAVRPAGGPTLYRHTWGVGETYGVPQILWTPNVHDAGIWPRPSATSSGPTTKQVQTMAAVAKYGGPDPYGRPVDPIVPGQMAMLDVEGWPADRVAVNRVLDQYRRAYGAGAKYCVYGFNPALSDDANWFSRADSRIEQTRDGENHAVKTSSTTALLRSLLLEVYPNGDPKYMDLAMRRWDYDLAMTRRLCPGAQVGCVTSNMYFGGDEPMLSAADTDRLAQFIRARFDYAIIWGPTDKNGPLLEALVRLNGGR